MPTTANKREIYEAMVAQAVDARLAASLSRRRLFRNAAIAGGGVAALGTVGIAGAQDSTPDSSPDAEVGTDSPFADDLEVFNYALTLEHLESAFYRDGLADIGEEGITGLGFQASVFANLSSIAEHEATHVETITAVIADSGGEPVEEAVYDFGYEDAAGFLEVAQALEDVGVQAYQGAAQYIEDPDLLTAALTIHGNEARHAAYLALLNEGNPFPEAFNPSLTPDEVLEIATPFFAE